MHILCYIFLVLGTSLSSASPSPSCCGRDSSSSSSEARQLRLPDGFSMALEPKILFNLWNSEDSGRMRLQSRIEFRYTPPKDATGRQARQLMERTSIFSSMRAGFAQFGLDGAACLQRAVCEVSRGGGGATGRWGLWVTLLLHLTVAARALNIFSIILAWSHNVLYT